MGLINSSSSTYPDALDDIGTPQHHAHVLQTTTLESISHVDKHIFLDGYIREICIDYAIPRCLIHLIINYFAISHCIMLYSRNDDTKRGKIDFIDLNQNKHSLQHVMTLKNSVHLNHKMHLLQRSTCFASNISFKHYNPSTSYHAIFTAKNIVRGGSVDAIVIDTHNTYHPVQQTLNLPFIGYGQTIIDLKYSYSLKSLIAQDSFEGYINTLPLNDEHKQLKWTRYKDKKYKMKVYGERQYLCNSCFITNNLYGNLKDCAIFVVNYECRGQIFNFRSTRWNKTDLSRFSKKKYRNDFGICFDFWNQRCFISGGCVDEFDYKRCINENFVHWSSYYDFHKNQWYSLPDTIHYHGKAPLLWHKNHILYIESSDTMHERESRHHWNYKDMDHKCEMNKIGMIEMYDTRCNEKQNKWRIAPEDKQLTSIIHRSNANSDYNNSYTPSKLLNCLL
eukprot:689686_1